MSRLSIQFLRNVRNKSASTVPVSIRVQREVYDHKCPCCNEIIHEKGSRPKMDGGEMCRDSDGDLIEIHGACGGEYKTFRTPEEREATAKAIAFWTRPPVGEKSASAPLTDVPWVELRDGVWFKAAARRKIYAVDLDGTLAHKEPGPFDPAHIGDPIPLMMDDVKAWRAAGHTVRIFTARAHDPANIPHVQKWLDAHGLGDCEITNQKAPDVDEIHDDRAVTRERNTGRILKSASDPRTAVIIRGNPKFIETPAWKSKAEAFYAELDALLKAQGYAVTHDAGEPLTEPPVADLWVGHSRGQDRLRFAPEGVRTVAADKFLDATHLDGEGNPTDKHFEVSDALREALTKSASLTNFRRPENFDRQEAPTNLLTKVDIPEGLKLYVGANDWEGPGWWTAALYKEDADVSKDEPVDFINIDHTNCIAKHRTEKGKVTGDLEHSNDRVADATCRAWAEREVWTWLKAKARETKSAFDAFKCPECGDRMGNKYWTPDGREHAIRGAAGCTSCGYLIRYSNQLPGAYIKKKGDPADIPPITDLTAADDATISEHVAKLNRLPPKGEGVRKVDSLDDLIAGIKDRGRAKLASALPAQPVTVPKTGPHAIAAAMRALDLDKMEAEARASLKGGKKTHRAHAVFLLNAVEGMRRNNITPADLLISKVPIMPARFRPFTMIGSTLTLGDQNEMLRDLVQMKQAHQKVVGELGEDGAGDSAVALYDTVKANLGYGDPINPKTLQRGVQGVLHKITGAGPKFSWLSSKMIAKPMDNTGRSVITANPDLGMDEVGIPRSMAWDLFKARIQGKLVEKGMKPIEALKHIKERSDEATKILEWGVKPDGGRWPVVYSRAPAWHQFNTISGWAKLHDGDSVQISPSITTGLNADFDGDTVNVHAYVTPKAIEEAITKLMPSKMIFSGRDFEKPVNAPKHEQILGLNVAITGASSGKPPIKFKTKADMIRAYEANDIDPNDDVEWENE